MATPLAAVVDASGRVAQTRSRRAKRDAIAECLRGADPTRSRPPSPGCPGETRQGRIGVGYATLAALRGSPAAHPR
jgi:DNA ligase-1